MSHEPDHEFEWAPRTLAGAHQHCVRHPAASPTCAPSVGGVAVRAQHVNAAKAREELLRAAAAHDREADGLVDDYNYVTRNVN